MRKECKHEKSLGVAPIKSYCNRCIHLIDIFARVIGEICYNFFVTDLDKRLNRDVVVISSHLSENLVFDAVTYEKDAACALIIEPEVISEALRQDVQTGAAAVIVNAIQYHESSLRQTSHLLDAELLAKNTCKTYECFKIAHPLVSVKQSNLPLDASNKYSLIEVSNDYKFIGQLFDKLPVDGFCLESFNSFAHLKCALVGLRKATNKTILVDISNIALGDDFTEYDYSPCSTNIKTLDFAKLQSTDALLAEGEKSIAQGVQFLTVKQGKPAQTAGLVALLQGIPLSN